jgi:DNA modification methylase
MQGRKADLVFMDPPYNVNYDGRGSVGESWLQGRRAKDQRVKKQTRTMLNDHLPDEQFLDFCGLLFGS